MASARQQGEGRVYRVEFLGQHSICQIRDVSDAKCHDDTTNLKERLLDMLGGKAWANRPAKERDRAARLFLPVAAPEEIEETFDALGWTDGDKATLRQAIRFWDDVALVSDTDSLPDEVGEVFFTYPDGYRLHPVE